MFYKINFLGGGRYFDISFLIGQDIDGNILSDKECRKLLLELSVFKTFESTYDKKLTLGFFEQDFKENAGYLRDKITKEQFFQRLMEEKAGSIDYAVRRLKMTAHSKKISLDIGIKKTREDFFALKREIENSTYTNIESIKMQKKLKLLENELNKKEYNLSLSKQKIDMETEKEIEDLKDIRKYHIEYREQHHIYLYPKSAYKE